MKTKTFLVIFCMFSAGLLCYSVLGATELWSYDGWKQIRQIVPDGKGGCAFVRTETNDVAEVVWLDKKGELVYKTDVNVTNNPSPINVKILFFKKKSLFINDVRNDATVVIEIDSKGQETITQSAGNNVGGPLLMGYTPNELSDKHGFFTTKLNIIDSRQKIIRFSYK